MQKAKEAEATAKKESQRLKDILPVKPVSGERLVRCMAEALVAVALLYPR